MGPAGPAARKGGARTTPPALPVREWWARSNQGRRDCRPTSRGERSASGAGGQAGVGGAARALGTAETAGVRAGGRAQRGGWAEVWCFISNDSKEKTVLEGGPSPAAVFAVTDRACGKQEADLAPREVLLGAPQWDAAGRGGHPGSLEPAPQALGAPAWGPEARARARVPLGLVSVKVSNERAAREAATLGSSSRSPGPSLQVRQREPRCHPGLAGRPRWGAPRAGWPTARCS